MTDAIAGDIDLDGDTDVVAMSAGGGCPNCVGTRLSVFMNDGAGDLEVSETVTPQNAAATTDFLNLFLADFDGDDFPDLVTTAAVSFNAGNGKFWPGRPHPARPRQFTVGDLNQDGRPDLVGHIFDGFNRNAVYFLNQGDGSLGELVVVEAVDRIFAPATADLDRDGDQDLLLESLSGNVLTVFENRLSFATSRDVDQDGIPDECERQVFHRGDSNDDGRANLIDATFLLKRVFLAGAAPSCAEATDANNDGRLTVADAIWMLRYLFNGGPPPPPPGPPGRGTPCGGDSDRDGDDGNFGCGQYESCP